MGERSENQYRPPRPGTAKTDYLSPASDRVSENLAADKPVFLTLGSDGKRGRSRAWNSSRSCESLPQLWEGLTTTTV